MPQNSKSNFHEFSVLIFDVSALPQKGTDRFRRILLQEEYSKSLPILDFPFAFRRWRKEKKWHLEDMKSPCLSRWIPSAGRTRHLIEPVLKCFFPRRQCWYYPSAKSFLAPLPLYFKLSCTAWTTGESPWPEWAFGADFAFALLEESDLSPRTPELEKVWKISWFWASWPHRDIIDVYEDNLSAG